MTRLEIANVLNGIMIENKFSIIERDSCHENNSDKINSMQKIFYLKESKDFTYLYAVSHLLSDKEKLVDDYLINENKDSTLVKNVKLPTREDLLLVATAFEENPEFFSMAWNWVIITEDRLNSLFLFKTKSDLSHPQSLEVDYPIYSTAAGTLGFNNLTKMPINFPFLGELEVRGNSETERLVFVLFIAPECREMKFKLNIYYEIDNKEYTATIIKESPGSTKEKRSQQIRIDFSKGIHIKKVEWKPL